MTNEHKPILYYQDSVSINNFSTNIKNGQVLFQAMLNAVPEKIGKAEIKIETGDLGVLIYNPKELLLGKLKAKLKKTDAEGFEIDLDDRVRSIALPDLTPLFNACNGVVTFTRSRQLDDFERFFFVEDGKITLNQQLIDVWLSQFKRFTMNDNEARIVKWAQNLLAEILKAETLFTRRNIDSGAIGTIYKAATRTEMFTDIAGVKYVSPSWVQATSQNVNFNLEPKRITDLVQ